MPYRLPDGRAVSPDMSFVLGADEAAITYPPNWLRTAPQQEKDALGITWEPDPVDAPVEPPLALVKEQLGKAVDDHAEAVRLRHITPGDGMQMTYREKFEQATAVNAMGQAAADALSQSAREASFPTLSASVGIEAATLWDCAQLVLQRYAAFAQLSFVIERARLSGKKAISEASDAASARAAFGAIQWPT